MEQFPFAVDNNSDTLLSSSPIAAAAADDSSSLVTASSQGSFIPTSETDDNNNNNVTTLGFSSLQANTDDENDLQIHHNHDAVFTHLTPREHPYRVITTTTPSNVQQPHLLPVEPINFGATMVELPPQPPSPASHVLPPRTTPTTVSQPPPSVMNTSTTTTVPPTSLLSGVDALKSAGSRVTSVLSNIGYNLGINSNTSTTTIATSSAPTIRMSNITTTTVSPVSNEHYVPPPPTKNKNTPKMPNVVEEAVAHDFAYIDVTDEDEVDVWLDENHDGMYRDDTVTEYGKGTDTIYRGNVLAVLLANDTSPPISQQQGTTAKAEVRPISTLPGDELVHFTEQANTMTAQAVLARKNGNLEKALDRHSDAAKLYHQAALLIREKDESLAASLLLLSQTQAKAALSLKRIIKVCPNALSSVVSTNNHRLRARVRGALNSSPEADISASTFLGKATKPQMQQQNVPQSVSLRSETTEANEIIEENSSKQNNLVDEMMELERELREMDMALALGNSIVTLDARSQNRMKSSVTESFMVIPGSGSFMSNNGSMILGPAPISTSRPYNPNIGGTAGVRARANRLQNVNRPSNASVSQHPHTINNTSSIPSRHHASVAPPTATPHNLESSWWGNASMASQILSASVISLAPGSSGQQLQEQAASTKQLMRLMDSMRTLREENANLLREVEDAEAARLEAKTAREQMKRFKEEYSKRFIALKEALEKFRKGYPGDISVNGESNPVTNSAFAKSASTSDQIQRQEQLIRKLTADLKKEKEECKRKDIALRKYESFYREVKARSAQKAAQKQSQQLAPQPNRSSSYRGSVK